MLHQPDYSLIFKHLLKPKEQVPERYIPLFESPADFTKLGVLTPGPILGHGFSKAVVDVLRHQKNTNLNAGIILGYSSEEIRSQCLEHGRADFTTDWIPGRGEGFSAQGKAYLYAYFYLRRHYFEMRQVIHGCEDFFYDHLFNRKAPLLIDLGSGPWTAAFALMDSFEQYHKGLPCTCTGFDRSDDMFLVGDKIRGASGRKVKDSFAKACDWNSEGSREYVYNQIRNFTPGASILITASYLFASSSLDATSLGEFVEGIIDAAQGRKVCFIETNTTATIIGNKFQKFVEATPSLQSLFGGQAVVHYHATNEAATRMYREYDEFSGEFIGEYPAPPSVAEFRYMFLGNEALALDLIGSLVDKSRDLFFPSLEFD